MHTSTGLPTIIPQSKCRNCVDVPNCSHARLPLRLPREYGLYNFLWLGRHSDGSFSGDARKIIIRPSFMWRTGKGSWFAVSHIIYPYRNFQSILLPSVRNKWQKIINTHLICNFVTFSICSSDEKQKQTLLERIRISICLNMSGNPFGCQPMGTGKKYF
jgi:hypothetical protein